VVGPRRQLPLSTAWAAGRLLRRGAPAHGRRYAARERSVHQSASSYSCPSPVPEARGKPATGTREGRVPSSAWRGPGLRLRIHSAERGFNAWISGLSAHFGRPSTVPTAGPATGNAWRLHRLGIDTGLLVPSRDRAAGGFGVGQTSVVRPAQFQVHFALAWRNRVLTSPGRSGMSEVDGDDQFGGRAGQKCAPGPLRPSGIAIRG
jgi:hypothetical protein